MTVTKFRRNMKVENQCFLLSTSPQTQPARTPRRTSSLALSQRRLHVKPRRNNTGKESDSETGLYYFGARYLDPKTGRWLSGDPAVSEYIPSAPVSDETRKRNGSLPGMGGVFNCVNLHVYHYAGNNPIKYVDPDGMEIEILGDETNQSRILRWINSISEQQYIIVDGKLQKNGNNINPYGSEQYSNSINYLIENGTTKIQIGDTYIDEKGNQVPLENDDNGEMQPGFTYGSEILKIMNVTVRGITSSVDLADGTKGIRNPSEILMHELAGHAEPRISDTLSNAIVIENSIMAEIGNKIPTSWGSNRWVRAYDINHLTHVYFRNK